MKLTDGIKTIDIRMVIWDDDASSYGPDYAPDFFEAGGLPYDDDRDAHTVEDLDYCIEQANDWASGWGDYAPADWENVDNRKVFVEDDDKGWEDVESIAAALYDGGWRAADRDELIKEYSLSSKNADTLVKELERLENLNAEQEDDE